MCCVESACIGMFMPACWSGCSLEGWDCACVPQHRMQLSASSQLLRRTAMIAWLCKRKPVETCHNFGKNSHQDCRGGLFSSFIEKLVQGWLVFVLLELPLFAGRLGARGRGSSDRMTGRSLYRRCGAEGFGLAYLGRHSDVSSSI